MTSTNWFENQLVEFCTSLTIRAVFFERGVRRSFFSAKSFWKLGNSLSFVIIQIAAGETWSWINSWSILLGVLSLEKVFVVGRVVLPLRFDLSQALCVCMVVFQVYKRCLTMLVWFLCDSRIFCVCFFIFWKFCKGVNFVNLLK